VYNPSSYLSKKSPDTTKRALKKCSPLDLAWLAGLLDGEGAFVIIREKNKTFSMRVMLNMADEETVNHVSRLIGYEDRVRDRPGTNRVQYHLVLHGRNALELILSIRPYLITKAKHADLMISFGATIALIRGRNLDGEIDKIRENLFLQIRLLQMGGGNFAHESQVSKE